MNKKEQDDWKSTLKMLGEDIAKLDQQIVGVLIKRKEAVLNVEVAKYRLGLSIYRGDVERKRLATIKELARQDDLSPSFIQAIFYLIIDESSKVQMIQRESRESKKRK